MPVENNFNIVVRYPVAKDFKLQCSERQPIDIPQYVERQTEYV